MGQKALCLKCRVVRLCLTGLLIAVSSVAGYHWGSIIQDGGVIDRFDYLIGGFMLILLVMAIFFAMDAISSRIEDQVQIDGDRLDRLAKLARTDDVTARKMELALEELANDNARLRELLHARGRHEAGAVAGQHQEQAGHDGRRTTLS